MVELNYIKETEEIIDLFSQHGLDTIARSLKDALDGASTGTELIMGVKYHLEQISEEDIPELVRPKVKKIISCISEILK